MSRNPRKDRYARTSSSLHGSTGPAQRQVEPTRVSKSYDRPRKQAATRTDAYAPARVDGAPSRYPRKDRDSRTGSSLRDSPVLAQRQAELARATKPHERLAKEQNRLERSLFTKAELSRAAEIGRQVNHEWREASLKVRGDALRIDALKLEARKKLERALARELPKYKEWKALRRAHMRAHGTLTQQTQAPRRFGKANIDWDVVLGLGTAARVFEPPFTTFDVTTIDQGGFVVSDESFARPNIGHLVNNLVYDQDQGVSIVAGLLGILPIANAASLVSCGVGFTTPSAGRLKIGADVQNIYNKLTFSVSDKIGFSSADVGIGVGLFALVVRGTEVERVEQNLLTTGLKSGGSDQSRTESNLDDTAPFTLSVETGTRLEAGESVLVLAGTEVGIGTILDDMHCRMDAVLWWQLQRLTIEMAVDVL